MRRCPDEQCVMHFTAAVMSVDRTPARFCDRCAGQARPAREPGEGG
ncbi:MAG: hypothetical protein ACP5KN_08930 [Armatimonadota bacterium]